jgi:predicted Zn-dependent protease
MLEKCINTANALQNSKTFQQFKRSLKKLTLNRKSNSIKKQYLAAYYKALDPMIMKFLKGENVACKLIKLSCI